MDAASRILSELATRERALDAQLEAARAEAQREIEAAEAQAARMQQEAQAQATQMRREFEQVLAEQTERIRSEARANAQQEVSAVQARSVGKLGAAVEGILRAVLP
ncbi:V-type ATP synthase subunit H [Deinococcus metallilatus]|uniref:V-type ATP synthase subunit H n=2 Tax=Deinococcus TaxID=1298 RepID=A0AAJ5F166_9DEIO|nr:V-type ATPase subunit subunit G family protein [Deinococcus metallilatus]MBB5296198.1 vacuolar-type H+-ATPase subunit H [Deinococcus metallilatus]QBY09755.1 V-type ATP synthase subunit H [Deinococcus metallilatus]RXJ08953.1 V-type ATP synthase subunit H [Deinococcus metallilatus]TLK23668.1 V-type ATP synthase subunit H [Deinococcus metallilatus]GMA14064.1 vacuolar type ATP synthase subunit [Deinococcus metallilatus]